MLHVLSVWTTPWSATLEAVDSPISERFAVVELGTVPYGAALELQRAHHAEVLAGRAGETAHRVLLVEHPPTITVTRRPDAAEHVLAGAEALAAAGVERCETDRGGDVTYHGPGQAVVYPIVDLQRLGLGIHAYIRALEEAAIAACGAWGLECGREQGATGVWTSPAAGRPARKVAAIGVRVSRGVTMHGMALNVAPDLSHFALIVPCGLHGRDVTSMRAELGDACPSPAEAGRRLAEEVVRAVLAASAAGPVTRP
jgi:lipoate-protein ligase B